MTAGRVAWIDHARGVGIVLVAMMYSAEAYGTPDGGGNWLLGLAAWANPIAIPAFFLIAGLFLHRAVFGSVPVYLDRKVLRLAYFFAVWLAIETVFFHAGAIFRNPAEFVRLYVSGWVSPQSPLWFIHELALFYIVTRLTRRLPASRLLAFAALFQVLQTAGLVQTGWAVADRFAEYFVFFYAGYAVVPLVFRFASGVTERPGDMAKVLALWFATYTAFVALGIAGLPVVSLILGFAGACAIIAAGVCLSRIPAARFAGIAGRHALVIYLGFFIPMHVLQSVLSASHILPDAGTASLVAAAAALGVSFTLYRVALDTPLRALYVRPQRLRLKAARSAQRGSLITSPVAEA